MSYSRYMSLARLFCIPAGQGAPAPCTSTLYTVHIRHIHTVYVILNTLYSTRRRRGRAACAVGAGVRCSFDTSIQHATRFSSTQESGSDQKHIRSPERLVTTRSRGKSRSLSELFQRTSSARATYQRVPRRRCHERHVAQTSDVWRFGHRDIALHTRIRYANPQAKRPCHQLTLETQRTRP